MTIIVDLYDMCKTGQPKLLPQFLIKHISCLASEEKRVDDVSLEPIRKEEFLAVYKKKLKEDQLQYEFKVSPMSHDL